MTQALNAYQTRQMAWLLNGLATRGFDELNSTHLSFISVLDCADNMASEIARRLNVSRQAIHKTVRELEGLGYVLTERNPAQRNSRVIRLTEKGEQLIAVARTMFAELDNHLETHLDSDALEALHGFLAAEF